jgi:serine/threonine protein kinase
MFDAIQTLHQKAFIVHKDIKPENFRVKSSDHSIKLIDFGIMTEFQNQKGVHIPECQVGFMGSPLTGSITALECFNQSRRDDLESLAYTYMFILDRSKIPWADDF